MTASRPLRVLAVDDDADTRTSLTLLLRAWGHDARTATDGPAALVMAAEFRPDVVLLDIRMPEMDGYEVARRLRATPSPPVLVCVTGYGATDDRHQAWIAGVDFHLVKPADPVELGRLLDMVKASTANTK